MSQRYDSVLSSFIEMLSRTDSGKEAVALAVELLGEVLEVQRVIIVYASPERVQPFAVEWSDLPQAEESSQDSLDVASTLLHLSEGDNAPLVESSVATSVVLAPIRSQLQEMNVASLVVNSRNAPGGRLCSTIVLQQERARIWSTEEVKFISDVTNVLSMLAPQMHANEPARAPSPLPLNQEQEYFRRYLVEKTMGAIVDFDVNGEVIFTNPSFRRATEEIVDEIRGLHYLALIEAVVWPEDKHRVEHAYRSVLEGRQQRVSLEYRVQRAGKSEAAWVLDRLGRVETEDGRLVGYESFSFDITQRHQAEDRVKDSEARYRRLVEHSDAIIFHTNLDQGVTFISQRALDFFGVSPEDFVAREPVPWFDLVHPDDRARVQRNAGDMIGAESSYEEEFRVINRVTGQVRWLLTRLMPVRRRGGELVGWDGFGLDITSRREAQEALQVQSKKVRALYTVSSAIRGYLETSNIAARGLQALCDATGAEAGVCYLYSTTGDGQQELVAKYGLSEDREEFPRMSSLSDYVAKHGQPVVISDLSSDPRANADFSDFEEVRSAVFVPISVEDETLGTIGLFSNQLAGFDGGDVMLVSAAANQIGLAARQANLFSAYKRQARNLAALYRVSHELTRNLSLDEICLQSFSIIRDELGLKRIWLGLVNSSATRIVGQAAYGPGLRKGLEEVNIDLGDAENPIAKAVRRREPVSLERGDDVFDALGVKRIFTRLAVNAVAVVPLVASGESLGVLAVQPSPNDEPLSHEQITLLRSLANEIASVLLAKRLEDQVAESDKMRAAGLLAAGIAHNFNNLLQAILGQASLLEMQATDKSKVLRASELISQAATKGAGLVRQLMSFAQLEQPKREATELNAVLKNLVAEFESGSSKELSLHADYSEELPRAYVDPAQIKQILLSLIRNATEAMQERGTVQLSTDSVSVTNQSPHYEVPYGYYVRVSVRDSGVGMTEEVKRRCFEPFFTTKNVDPGSGLGMSGTGLGLAAAYALARRNGGTLVVESRRGSGSTFSLYLPVATEEEEQVKPVTGASPSIGQVRRLEIERIPNQTNGNGEPFSPREKPELRSSRKDPKS